MFIDSRILRSAILLALVVIVGVSGYVLIEGWSFVDAVYMTVITVTTVGYDEVRPLSTQGRVSSIFFMVGGVAVVLYILTITMQAVVEGQILTTLVRRRRMKARWSGLNQHFILCGYGRVGTEVARILLGEGVQVVAVDLNPEAIVRAEESGLLFVQGDGTRDEILQSAGIDSARGLVAALPNDSDNVYVTLTAKGLNPSLTIVARSTDPDSFEKLRMAGADQVVSPQAVGGRRLALSALRPRAVDFLDTVFDTSDSSIRLAEVEVPDGSPHAGSTVSQFHTATGAQVLAIVRQSGELAVSPEGGTVIEPGDSVMLVGRDSRLRELEVE